MNGLGGILGSRVMCVMSPEILNPRMDEKRMGMGREDRWQSGTRGSERRESAGSWKREFSGERPTHRFNAPHVPGVNFCRGGSGKTECHPLPQIGRS